MIRVLFFARLREQLGQSELEFSVTPGLATVADLRCTLSERGDNWREALASDKLICAVNQVQAMPDQAVADGDEVAFFPPVTGG